MGFDWGAGYVFVSGAFGVFIVWRNLASFFSAGFRWGRMAKTVLLIVALPFLLIHNEIRYWLDRWFSIRWEYPIERQERGREEMRERRNRQFTIEVARHNQPLEELRRKAAKAKRRNRTILTQEDRDLRWAEETASFVRAEEVEWDDEEERLVPKPRVRVSNC